MSKVLFLSAPAHGNVNPTLGLVNELVKQGEEVIYFSSVEFREKIETTGAIFKSYNEDLDIFKGQGAFEPMHRVLRVAPSIIADILDQVKSIRFDYLIHSAAFPFTKVIAQVLNLPTVSSLAIFAGLRQFSDKINNHKALPGTEEMMKTYQKVAKVIQETYGVEMPDTIMKLIFNRGIINLVYTSKYFAPDPDFFDDSYKFVGPPIYDRKENLDFPFEKLSGKKVIYISLGTVFSNHSLDLYEVFFKSFADIDAVIVLAAYNVDVTQFHIPANFIVRNYVPQSALLKYTDVAITHAGMNSISDLVSSHIPFVAIPLGADQPLLAKRTEELGTAIALDVKTLNPEILREAVEKVLTEPSYLENIKKIAHSFEQAGGYPKAVEEIFSMKKEMGI
ncbi:MAG: glycosyltransferase, family [Mucilaginibacter sp.]|nr:glycosyltransferase, family [Mucilaginibacter sp.]